ncbi:hypothetical protein S40293_00753 [Stachybotrys chartarum IBT 40293]|nr:hypothetical protein S40293_00753 [Stachybotrys chartarum IBT 40293]
MPGVTADVPAVALSFANNFWGKEDAGVGPMLERMQGAKQTCDELRSFYGARASIEDEYARKLLSLCRKSLGSQEMGTLKTSLDTLRGEVEAMAKQHQFNAAQMKSELEEPLAAFAGGIKERRKIVQNTVEKLLKVKIQQTQQVNKTREKYEQECLKIKGYLAQGHMVMGQEERRNKAKLEKTQISLATSNTEYENAIKALEDTTARWNREWKAAADKFQDLEEERLDFTKSSLWTFANIASTVCVSDDASCEKIRLSLEKMDVEKDIITFISERGTGQEIPEPPKYINYCRGDINDNQSETSEDDNYSVAQFPRSINPAFRSSSPQPSTFESHHDPNSALANNLAHRETTQASSREAAMASQKIPQPSLQQPTPVTVPMRASVEDEHQQYSRHQAPAPLQYDADQRGPLATVPHDPYPMDGMTMLCRTGPASDLSSQITSARPSSGDSHSDYSNPASYTTPEPTSGATSPMKQEPEPARSPEKRVLKKKSGFFQNHSPFRRKSVKEIQAPAQTGRNTWHASNFQASSSPTRRPQLRNHEQQPVNLLSDRTASPEPIDANASLALGVGQNVLPVTASDNQGRGAQPSADEVEQLDPIAMALAEIKGVTLNKESSVRVSADRYHGISTPAPSSDPVFSRSVPTPGGRDMAASSRGTPPPLYNGPVSRLGVPPPAVTSKAMKEATKKATTQTRTIFGDNGRSEGGYGTSPVSRPGTRGNDMPRAASPAPTRSVSPLPFTNHDPRRAPTRSASPLPPANQDPRRAPPRSASPLPFTSQDPRRPPTRSASPLPPANQDPRRSTPQSASPNPYSDYDQQRNSQASLNQRRGPDQGYSRHASPHENARGPSPSPYRDYARPPSARPQSSYGGGDMAVQLAPAGDERYGSSRSRAGSVYGGSVHGGSVHGGSVHGGSVHGGSVHGGSVHGGSVHGGSVRGDSHAMGLYEGGSGSHQRSRSVADPARQYTRDGRPILHYGMFSAAHLNSSLQKLTQPSTARASYMYQAAIPEELGFAKGDYLAVLRKQDDGWWEAEIHGGNGRAGLVPSNYLQPC